jgi:Tol biopolymer transport system component
MAKFYGTVFYDNEIAKTTDFNVGEDAAHASLALAFNRFFGLSTAKMIVSGFTVVQRGTPSMNVDIGAGMALDPALSYFLYNDTTYGPLAFDASHATLNRYDVVEMRRTTLNTNTQQRAIKDPITGTISYSNIPVEKNYVTEFQVKKGTNGASPSAPTVDSGWIKIAEVYIAATVTTILDANIKNVDAGYDGASNTAWTTEATSTFTIGTMSSFKSKFRAKHTETGEHTASNIPIVDAGSRITATDVEGALQEIAQVKKVITGDETLVVESRNIVAATNPSSFLLLTLPASPSIGDVIEIICLSACKIIQSLAEQVISWKQSLFTTKGTTGFVQLSPGDNIKLRYKGTGFSLRSPGLKITNPVTLPPAIGAGAAWSPDGRYLALACQGSPYVVIYDWISGVPVKITNPATLPTGNASNVAWSPDGRYLAVAHTNSPRVTIYDWISGVPVKIADPATLPTSTGTVVAWSPDGRYLGVSHLSSPYITIYDWISGAPVKITNPATLPTSIGYGVAWSPDGRFISVSHTTTPFVTIYDCYSGVPLKITDPLSLPTGNGLGSSWSPDGRYLVISHSTSPYITIYDWIRSVPLKLTDLITLPVGDSNGAAWSPDGRYLAVAHTTSPYITIYDWISGVPVKIADPATLPTGIGYGVAWSPDGRYLAVAHTTSPYVTIYDWRLSASREWLVEIDSELVRSIDMSNAVGFKFK